LTVVLEASREEKSIMSHERKKENEGKVKGEIDKLLKQETTYE